MIKNFKTDYLTTTTTEPFSDKDVMMWIAEKCNENRLPNDTYAELFCLYANGVEPFTKLDIPRLLTSVTNALAYHQVSFGGEPIPPSPSFLQTVADLITAINAKLHAHFKEMEDKDFWTYFTNAEARTCTDAAIMLETFRRDLLNAPDFVLASNITRQLVNAFDIVKDYPEVYELVVCILKNCRPIFNYDGPWNTMRDIAFALITTED